MADIKIFNCIKCPHYEIPDMLIADIIAECFFSAFNEHGDCPCTKCEDINDCDDWCSEYYQFEERIYNL